MKLSDKMRPATLADIVGHPRNTDILRGWVSDPFPCCWLFSGPPGTGKTSSALALANELDSAESTTVVSCSDLGIDNARELMRRLSLRPMFGAGKWQVLILEEMERLSPACQVFLKVTLESLPGRAVVVATSNNTANIDGALLQRFTDLEFAGDEVFAMDCRRKIAEVWEAETGLNYAPDDWTSWGRSETGFSLRVAYDRIQQELLLSRRRKPVVEQFDILEELDIGEALLCN